MRNVFKKLIDDTAIEISEQEYKELVATDIIMFGGSISVVKNNGTNYTYIPYKNVRQAQCPPVEFKLPSMTEVEKMEFIKKFKKAMIDQQYY